MIVGIVEVAAFRIPAGLAAPGIEGVIQEGIDVCHGGLETDAAAVGHVQLHHHIAALNDVEPLALDVTEAVSIAFLAEGGQDETVRVIEMPKVA